MISNDIMNEIYHINKFNLKQENLYTYFHYGCFKNREIIAIHNRLKRVSTGYKIKPMYLSNWKSFQTLFKTGFFDP